MTLEWRSAKVVAYRDFAYERLWEASQDPIGTFPHEAVRRLRRSEYLALRDELLRLYDELFDTLERGETFAPPWTQRFSALIDTLMEPALVPFYRAIAPGFVDRFVGGDAATSHRGHEDRDQA